MILCYPFNVSRKKRLHSSTVRGYAKKVGLDAAASNDSRYMSAVL